MVTCLHGNMTEDFLEPGLENDHVMNIQSSLICVNMRIVDIQYTVTVIVYCIVYGRSCDTYTFHLSG